MVEVSVVVTYRGGVGRAGHLECSVCMALPQRVHFVVIEQIMFL